MKRVGEQTILEEVDTMGEELYGPDGCYHALRSFLDDAQTGVFNAENRLEAVSVTTGRTDGGLTATIGYSLDDIHVGRWQSRLIMPSSLPISSEHQIHMNNPRRGHTVHRVPGGSVRGELVAGRPDLIASLSDVLPDEPTLSSEVALFRRRYINLARRVIEVANTSREHTEAA